MPQRHSSPFHRFLQKSAVRLMQLSFSSTLVTMFCSKISLAHGCLRGMQLFYSVSMPDVHTDTSLSDPNSCIFRCHFRGLGKAFFFSSLISDSNFGKRALDATKDVPVSWSGSQRACATWLCGHEAPSPTESSTLHRDDDDDGEAQ